LGKVFHRVCVLLLEDNNSDYKMYADLQIILVVFYIAGHGPTSASLI